MTDPAIAQLLAAMRVTFDQMDAELAVVDGIFNGQDNHCDARQDIALPAIVAMARFYGQPANLAGLTPAAIAMTFRTIAATAQGFDGGGTPRPI